MSRRAQKVREKGLLALKSYSKPPQSTKIVDTKNHHVLKAGMVYKPHDLPQGKAAARRRKQMERRFLKMRKAIAPAMSAAIAEEYKRLEPELDQIEDSLSNIKEGTDELQCAVCVEPLPTQHEGILKIRGWIQARNGAWVCPTCLAGAKNELSTDGVSVPSTEDKVNEVTADADQHS